MSETTGIEYVNYTASPWFGCTEVSAGCVNCYSREMTLQKKWAGWGNSSPRVRSKGFWTNVLKWNRLAGIKRLSDGVIPEELRQIRPRIFTSLMDWLDPMVPIEWWADFLCVVRECVNLDWLLLTKRPENLATRYRALRDEMVRHSFPRPENLCNAVAFLEFWFGDTPPRNVWLGATVENQEMADDRLPVLREIPARVRWVSVEPLLEEIDLGEFLAFPGQRWVVVGGESGSKRRDCGVEAIVDVAHQCQSCCVPVFVKQDCAARPGQQGRIPDSIWRLKQFP